MSNSKRVIVKEVNRKYDTEIAAEILIKYVLGEIGKHSGEEIIRGGRYICYDTAEHVMQRFVDTQSYYRKANRKRVRHWVVSFPKWYRDINGIKKIAKELSEKYFGEYECLFAIHQDKPRLHFHLVFNPVSLISGKKWHVSRTEFNLLREEVVEHCEKRMRKIG